MKTYDEFKKELTFFLENNSTLKDWSYIVLDKGFSKEDAIKTKFFLTKSTKEWNEFILDTNTKFFNVEALTLQGDLIIMHKEKKYFSRFSIENLYDEYKTNEDFANLIECMKPSLALAEGDVGSIAERMDDYDFIKKYLMIRPLNYTENKSKLTGAVYKLIDDIALVVYAKLSDPKDNVHSALLSAKIPEEVFEKWRFDFEEFFDEVMLNTYSMSQPRLFNFNDFNTYTQKPCVTLEGAFMAINLPENAYRYNDDHWYVLTTTSKTNGSVAIFYPNVKERIYEMIGKDYYVSFVDLNSCNIKEVEDDMTDDEYKDFNNKHNAYAMLPYMDDTRISKDVYRYYGATKELKKI